MFDSSSRSGRRTVDSDGSHPVVCWRCGALLCRSNLGVTRALCAMCYAGDEHKIIPAEAVEDYMLGRAMATGSSVSGVYLNKNRPSAPEDAFSFGSMGGGILRALGFRRPPKPNTQSRGISKARQRGRLLDDLEAATPSVSLGVSMSAMDKELKSK